LVITLTTRWGYNNNKSGVLIICQIHENQININLRRHVKKIIKVNILNYFQIKKIKELKNSRQSRNYFNHLAKKDDQAFYIIFFYSISFNIWLYGYWKIYFVEDFNYEFKTRHAGQYFFYIHWDGDTLNNIFFKYWDGKILN